AAPMSLGLWLSALQPVLLARPSSRLTDAPPPGFVGSAKTLTPMILELARIAKLSWPVALRSNAACPFSAPSAKMMLSKRERHGNGGTGVDSTDCGGGGTKRVPAKNTPPKMLQLVVPSSQRVASVVE